MLWQNTGSSKLPLPLLTAFSIFSKSFLKAFYSPKSLKYLGKLESWWKETPRYGGRIHPSDGGGKHPVMVEEITPPSPF